jgi:molecular chaperone GrpE (heat shock protein)
MSKTELKEDNNEKINNNDFEKDEKLVNLENELKDLQDQNLRLMA